MYNKHSNSIFSFHAGWLVLIAAMLLTWLGIEAIETTRPATASRQLALGLVGFFFAFVMVLIPVQRYRQGSWWFFGFGMVLLVILIIPGIPDFLVHPRNGARRWINVVIMDMQPSELVKIGFVLALASYLRFKNHYREMKGLVTVLAIAMPPMLLIVVEPDLGTAMLFLPALIAMLIVAGARFKHLIIIALIGIVASLAMYPLLRPHQKDRIQALVAQIEGDDRFEQSIGYQGARAMTLIGAGGTAGVMKQKAADLLKSNHLPEEHNDMIFAVICLRFGLVGAIGMWLLYLLLAIGGLCAAVNCKDPFPRLVSVGLTAMILGQMVINTAMTLGIAPITGLTLPFVSAGGSSLVVTWCMAGILFNIARHRDPMMTREGFLFS